MPPAILPPARARGVADTHQTVGRGSPRRIYVDDAAVTSGSGDRSFTTCIVGTSASRVRDARSNDVPGDGRAKTAPTSRRPCRPTR